MDCDCVSNGVKPNNFLTGAAQCLGEIYRLFGRKITAGLIETSNIVAKLMKYHEVACFSLLFPYYSFCSHSSAFDRILSDCYLVFISLIYFACNTTSMLKYVEFLPLFVWKQWFLQDRGLTVNLNMFTYGTFCSFFARFQGPMILSVAADLQPCFWCFFSSWFIF